MSFVSKKHLIGLLGLITSLVMTNASAITISGFSDWKIDQHTLKSKAHGVKYKVEDQKDNYLNPGYGGQDYDAEGIYVTQDKDYLYVALITGRKQDPGSGWAPGDFAFDIGSDGTFEYGLVTSSDASDPSNRGRGGIGSPGDFFQVDEWNYGIWNSPGNSDYSNWAETTYKGDHPVSVDAGTKIADASETHFDYSLLGDEYGNGNHDWGYYDNHGHHWHQHYFVSAKINLDWFSENDIAQHYLTIHWASVCNNDWIDIDTNFVPVASTMPLFALGAFILVLGVRRRKF